MEPLKFQSARGLKNVVCGIDVQTQSTWFAFNTKTGDFACLTNFRTQRNRTLKKKYQSRGFLVLEYVKINDPDIAPGLKMPLEKFLSLMYDGTFKGFNILFGNILDSIESERPRCGILRVYTDPNLPEEAKKFVKPATLVKQSVHGISNGGINVWNKVHVGKQNFFKVFLRGEQDIKGVAESEFKNYFEAYATELHQVMLDERR